jgi:site-specific recombinase XerD
MTTPSFAPLLQSFFTRRLMQQKQVSPHTIVSYRDTFRLLLRFAEQRLKKPPSRLSLDEIDAPFIGSFLHDLEKNRGIAARSRNLRLTAIRSFFHFVAFEAPDHSAMIQRVLAIPGKRYTRKQVHFLTRAEATALLAMPDQKTWSGRRDHALLLVALQAGLSRFRTDKPSAPGCRVRHGSTYQSNRKRAQGTLHANNETDGISLEVVDRQPIW